MESSTPERPSVEMKCGEEGRELTVAWNGLRRTGRVCDLHVGHSKEFGFFPPSTKGKPLKDLSRKSYLTRSRFKEITFPFK